MMDSFLAELAKPQPNPGGGAAAAYGALVGLALLEKVFELEYARIGPGQNIDYWNNKKRRIAILYERMKNLREEDRQIYPRLMQAGKSKGNRESLKKIIDDSIAVPLRIMQGTIVGLALLSWLAGRCQEILKADLWVAAELIKAALQGAFHIGWANLPLARKFLLPIDYAQDLQNSLQKGEETFQQARKILSVQLEALPNENYCR